MLVVPLMEIVGLLGKGELPAIQNCLSSVILHIHVASFFPGSIWYAQCPAVLIKSHTCSELGLIQILGH